jgi:hypothetical protein
MPVQFPLERMTHSIGLRIKRFGNTYCLPDIIGNTCRLPNTIGKDKSSLRVGRLWSSS